MASTLLKLHLNTTTNSLPPISFSKTISPPTLSTSLTKSSTRLLLFFQNSPPHKLTCCSVPSTQEFCSPPTSREEAISQAKFVLSIALKKPLNNPVAIPTRKLKKLSQLRCRVEIPVVDDSPTSLTQLAFDVFSNLPISKKGSKPNILILWDNSSLSELADKLFESTNSITNSELVSVSNEVMNSADLAVFFAPGASQLDDIKRVSTGLYPKPVVLFNPKWGFEDEKDFAVGGFIGSFGVIYSFMGLEVKGVIRRRRGVVFKCIKDRVARGEEWLVMVEDKEGKGKGGLRVVTKFKQRPSIVEVESVLYNLMAANSPVTKSVKFLRDLASNVIGKKD